MFDVVRNWSVEEGQEEDYRYLLSISNPNQRQLEVGTHGNTHIITDHSL